MSVGQKISSRLLTEAKKKKKTSFLQDMKDEMKKVSWTSKEELKICTKIVLGATFAFGIGIYVVDLIIKNFLDFLRLIVNLVA